MKADVKMGCTAIKLSAPPAGRTGPLLTVALKEVGEGVAGSLVWKDCPEHIAQQLRAGLMDESQYAVTITLTKVRKAQGDLFPARPEREDDLDEDDSA